MFADATRVALFALGAWLVFAAMHSAFRTVALPRGAVSTIARAVYLALRWVCMKLLGKDPSVERVDKIMGYYGPLGLFLVLGTWIFLTTLGFALMYLAIDQDSISHAIRLSGSSIFTLGFSVGLGDVEQILSFIEAGLGLLLLAMMITYLPSIYSAFSRRERFVMRLEVRAGSPPSGEHVIEMAHRLERFETLQVAWMEWEAWFADVAETHTSFPSLTFFRSQRADHNWLIAAGAILDAAAFRVAAVDEPREIEAELCIRAGYLCLQQIADYFGIAYDGDPAPDAPISVTREEWDQVMDRLAAQGVPLRADRDQAWRDWAGWRVNYDTPLVMLCRMTLAPPAQWSSDRDRRGWKPGLFRPAEGQVSRKRRGTSRASSSGSARSSETSKTAP